jgi:superfamily I DNA/RNA helicase
MYLDYSRELSRLGVHDFGDVILKAEASLKAKPLEGYSAVIIDEAQDLTCAMVRMLHSLVGDKPDGLHLIGDGQQSIYPGGFTLSEMGISISGRATVMTTNYRNTAEIVAFADSLVLGDEFVDIEGAASAADSTAAIVRRGAEPTIARFTSKRAHDVELTAQLQSLHSSGVKYGDIAVLAMKNWDVSDAAIALRTAGIPYIELTEYTGRPVDAVKLGTVHRAKGLEFKHVLVARTPKQLLGESSMAADTSDRERRDLDRRALYVAMTRARDGLWIGVA